MFYSGGNSMAFVREACFTSALVYSETSMYVRWVSSYSIIRFTKSF